MYEVYLWLWFKATNDDAPLLLLSSKGANFENTALRIAGPCEEYQIYKLPCKSYRLWLCWNNNYLHAYLWVWPHCSCNIQHFSPYLFSSSSSRPSHVLSDWVFLPSLAQYHYHCFVVWKNKPKKMIKCYWFVFIILVSQHFQNLIYFSTTFQQEIQCFQSVCL